MARLRPEPLGAALSAVVCGAAMITALGDTRATWRGLLAGRSGVGPIRRFDASAFPVRFGAEVDGEGGPETYEALLDAVVDEALRDTELDIRPERIGVFLGAEAIRPHPALLAAGAVDPELVARHHPARLAARAAGRIGAKGPVATLSIACTSSAQAVGEAMMAIRRGEIDVAVAAGVDVLVHPLMVLGFSRLGALSTRNEDPAAASRPFDSGRDGFVLGDGAGALLLASKAVADRVGPRLGRVIGYASTSNAWRITDTPPDGAGTRAALVGALREAGCAPEAVAYVNAHGTSTAQNDVGEARAIRAALGDRVPVSSTKSMTGHLVAACGVVEAIVTLLAARERLAPPTLNLERVDPDCALCHVIGEARPLGAGPAVSNAAGFGGSNTSLVFEAP